MPVSGINMTNSGSSINYTAGSGSAIASINTNPVVENVTKTKAQVEEMDLTIDTETSEVSKVEDKKSVLASAELLGLKIIGGAIRTGEGVRDLVETTGTDVMGKIHVGAQTTMMALKDTFGSGATEADYKELDRRLKVYDEMLKDTKAEVAEDLYAEYISNPIMEKTGLMEKAYAAETISDVGYGIGQTLEIIGLSLAGGYVLSGAGAAAGATAEGAASTAGSSALRSQAAKVLRPIIAGVTGAGEGIQTAFQDDADYHKGMIYGYAKGLWDSAQWFVGEKINGLKAFGKEGFESQVRNSISHVILDSVDGGAEGIVQPFLQKIYKNESFNELFEAAGGWKNVGTQAIIGGVMSTFGEASDVLGAYKMSKQNVLDDVRIPLGENPAMAMDNTIAENTASSVEKVIKKQIMPDMEITVDAGINIAVKNADGTISFKPKDTKLTFEEILEFLNKDVEFDGSYKFDITDPDNFFVKHDITPNELAHTLFKILEEYDLDGYKDMYRKNSMDFFSTVTLPKYEEFKFVDFIKKNYSSLDERSINLDNWMHSGLIEEIKEECGEYITSSRKVENLDEYLKEKLADTAKFFNNDNYYILGRPPGSIAFNNGKTNYINTDIVVERFIDVFERESKSHAAREKIIEQTFKDSIFHESLHQLSVNEEIGFSGFQSRMDGTNRGINEAVTELICMMNKNSIYMDTGRSQCGYKRGIELLTNLIDEGFFSMDELKQLYFANDISGFRNKLATGTDAISGLSEEEIDKVIDNIALAVLSYNKSDFETILSVTASENNNIINSHKIYTEVK